MCKSYTKKSFKRKCSINRVGLRTIGPNPNIKKNRSKGIEINDGKYTRPIIQSFVIVSNSVSMFN